MRGFSFPSCSESGGLLFDAPAGSGGGLEKSTVQASGESSPPAGLPAAAPRRVHGSSPLIHGSGQRRVEPARGAAASSCTSTSPWIKPRCGSSPAQRRRLEESARFEPAAAASLLWLEPAVVQARPRCCQRRRLETSTVQAGVALPAVRPPAAAARNLHGSSPLRFKTRARCSGQRRRLETSLFDRAAVQRRQRTARKHYILEGVQGLNTWSMLCREPTFEQMTAVGFEPPPFRNGALSHRLRPLGQTVMFACNEQPL